MSTEIKILPHTSFHQAKNYLIQNPVQKQNNHCFGTYSPKKQRKLQIENGKNFQPVVVSVAGRGQSDCPNCKLMLKKLMDVRKIKDEVSFLKTKNEELSEQIQLLTNNFMYILELASENIIKGVQNKMKNILTEKQNLINKQSQIIKRLQKQSEMLIDKVDAGLQLSERLEDMEEKIKQLQNENSNLKAEQIKLKINQWDSESIQMKLGSTDDGGNSPKEFKNFFCQFDFPSPLISPPSLRPVKNFGQSCALEKPKTIQAEGQINQLKNLDSLRSKINRMKQKILQQNI